MLITFILSVKSSQILHDFYLNPGYINDIPTVRYKAEQY